MTYDRDTDEYLVKSRYIDHLHVLRDTSVIAGNLVPVQYENQLTPFEIDTIKTWALVNIPTSKLRDVLETISPGRRIQSKLLLRQVHKYRLEAYDTDKEAISSFMECAMQVNIQGGTYEYELFPTHQLKTVTMQVIY